MDYEVEQKFVVSDTHEFEQSLSALGVFLLDPVIQVDRYFAHPARNFANTDEALRIRCVGSENTFTYKGPKIDSSTKTRKEIEVRIEPGKASAMRCDELLQALGFRPVAEIHKQRRCGTVPWQGLSVRVVLDTVDDLGTFTELEITTTKTRVDRAKKAVLSLARELSLDNVERRSYLELVLERKSGG